MNNPHILIAGDNLTNLKKHEEMLAGAGAVYCDPPFFSQRSFTAPTGTHFGVAGFKDHFESPQHYIDFMAPRIAAAWKLLSPTGNLLIHCDQSGEHYLRMACETVCGRTHFAGKVMILRNHQKKPTNGEQRVEGGNLDTLLRFRKSNNSTYTPPTQPLSPTELHERKKYYRVTAPDGRPARWDPLDTQDDDKTNANAKKVWRGQRPGAGRHWRWTRANMETKLAEGWIIKHNGRYKALTPWRDEVQGVRILSNYWDQFTGADNDGLKWPTEKSKKLLQCILNTYTQPRDSILDLFAGGSKLTVAAAYNAQGHKIVGFEEQPAAIEVAKLRAQKHGYPLQIIGRTHL